MTEAFRISPTPLAGLLVVERLVREDSRGFFSRFYCDDAFRAAGIAGRVRQINHTLTRHAGALRGLHFQYPPDAEDKFVSCISGEVFDVAVDLRRDSPTFLRWHAERLSAANHRSLLVPKGFAHGFQTLVPDCELIYLHTHPFAPRGEGAVNATDPKLSIPWPLVITDISERDQSHPPIADDFLGLEV